MSPPPISACFNSLRSVSPRRKKTKFPTLTEVGRPRPSVHQQLSSEEDSESENQRDNREPNTLPHYDVNRLLQEAKDHIQEPTSDFGPESYSTAVDLDEVRMSAPELCVLLLSLLRKFALENRWMEQNSESLAATMVSLLMGLMENMHENLKPDWSPEEFDYVQLFIVRLMISLMALVSQTNDGVAYLEHEKFVTRLLTIAQTISAPGVTDTKKQLCSDIVHGLWMLMRYAFDVIPNNPSVIKHAVKLFHQLMAESDLCKTKMTDGLLETVTDVSLAIQQTKINYMHSVKCKKRHHSKCDFSLYGHHHHDLVGVAITAYHSEELTDTSSSNIDGPLPCCLAAVTDLLLQIAEENPTNLKRSRLLAAFDQSGVCCCISQNRLVTVLLALAPRSLPLLVRLLSTQCGAGHQDETCSLCGFIKREHTPGFASDSAFSSSENSLLDLDHIPATRWRYLSNFLPRISKNDSSSMAILQHVFLLAERANKHVEQELFQHVFLPLLLDCTHERIREYCLSGLPILLQSSSIYQAFMVSQGLDFVMSCPRSQMLTILQVLILLSKKDERPTQVFLETLTEKTKAWLEEQDSNSKEQDLNSCSKEQDLNSPSKGQDLSSPSKGQDLNSPSKGQDLNSPSQRQDLNSPSKEQDLNSSSNEQDLNSCSKGQESHSEVEDLWTTAHMLQQYSSLFRQLFSCSDLALTVVRAGLQRQEIVDEAWTAAFAIYMQHNKIIKVSMV